MKERENEMIHMLYVYYNYITYIIYYSIHQIQTENNKEMKKTFVLPNVSTHFARNAQIKKFSTE